MLARHPRHPGHHHAAGPAGVRAAARATGSQWGLSLQLRRAARARRPGPGLPHRPRVHRRRPGCAGPGRQHLLRRTDLSDTLQRAAGRRSRAPRSSATTCTNPERYGVVEFDAAGRAVGIEEKPAPPAVQLRRHRPLLLRQPGGRHRPRASGRRRAASWRSPTSTARYLERGRARRSRLLGRGIAWLDTGTHESLLQAGQLHRDDRGAAGPQDRLPRGDRLPHGLHRRRSSWSGWREPLRQDGYGQYLLGSCCRSAPPVKVDADRHLPDVLLDRARRCSATTAASSSRPGTPSASPQPGMPAPFVQDNHSRSVARHAARAALPDRASRRASWCGWSRGAVFDVAVDMRRGSPTFGRWVGVELLGDEPATAVDPAGLRARLLRAERDRPTCSTSAPTTTRRSTSAPCVGRSATSAIAWPLRGRRRRCSRPRTPRRRRFATRRRYP